MDDKDKIILEHYKRVAKNFGHAPTSTMKDQNIRQAEILFFTSQIDPIAEKKPHLKILDVGCGNGHLLSLLRDRYPSAELHGIEFTPELHDLSVGRNLDVNFINGDCRKLSDFPLNVDVLITERVLINILDESERLQVLKNIVSVLKKNSVFLMSESFKGPLKNLNKARLENNLEEIPVPKKNDYLNEDEISFLKNLGLKETEHEMGSNYLSTQFFTTRILHHLIKPEGALKEGTEVVQFLIEGIGPGVGNYSPILFRKFHK